MGVDGGHRRVDDLDFSVGKRVGQQCLQLPAEPVFGIGETPCRGATQNEDPYRVLLLVG